LGGIGGKWGRVRNRPHARQRGDTGKRVESMPGSALELCSKNSINQKIRWYLQSIDMVLAAIKCKT
jgi:hypothetical protein